MSFASRLTPAQMRFARYISDRLSISISQVVKAFERHDNDQIAIWKEQLDQEGGMR